MMKRALALALSICLLTGLLVFPASAEADPSGTCGDNLVWRRSGNSLFISGTGPMYDYTEENLPQWYIQGIPLWKVVITEGVTSIGDYAFYGSTATTDFKIPASIERIGKMAFAEKPLATWYHFLGGAPVIAEDAFHANTHAYVFTANWDSSVKLDYGGSLKWRDAEIVFEPFESKMLLELNEEFNPEDLKFKMVKDTGNEFYDYVPRQVTFSHYDSSCYGEKNITITADGYSFDFTFFVTDGTNHLDLIRVEIPANKVYIGQDTCAQPIVSIGSLPLNGSGFYSLADVKMISAGINGSYTIVGNGICEGFEKTFYFPILKKDISEADASPHHGSTLQFTGSPVKTFIPAHPYKEETDYSILYENNINFGTATARLVGTGNCYGENVVNYEIQAKESTIVLPGTCIGTIDGELSEEFPINEKIVAPGVGKARVDYSGLHIAAYALYRMDDEEMTLIDEWTSEADYWFNTAYQYDVSNVYEDAADTGGEVYLLSYSWVTTEDEIYAGAMFMVVPSKVANATSMVLQYAEHDGDFRKEYLSMVGDDGVLGEITWTTSDPSIATVDKGTVTLKKPGKVTITGQYNGMARSIALTSPALDLTEGIIFDYSEPTDTAQVIYDSRLLEEGTDYILSVSYDENGERLITATGCGLFQGQLVKEFDGGPDDLANPHTHGFDSICDGTCNSCEYTRSNDHSFSDKWTKNQTHHWHACTVCGARTDEAEHALSPEDSEVCTVCGTLYIPGDIDCNMLVNRDDVVQLLLHVSMPSAFPIEVSADFTGDGTVNRDDVVQLLLHVSMPDAFPLSA